MTGTFIPSQSRQVQPTTISEGPPPDVGMFGEVAAAFRTTQDDVDVVQEKRLFEAYGEIEEALVEMGVDRAKLREDAVWSPFGTPDVASRPRSKDAIWAALENARKVDGSKFPGIPKTKVEYEQWVLNRKGKALRDQQIAANANIAVSFAGGMAGSFTDPFNVLTLPISAGGKTVAQVALREGILNFGLEGYQQFDLAESRRARGEKLTAGEVAMNVVSAGAGGFVLGGATKYGVDNWGAIKSAPKAMQEAVWAKVAPYLPEAMRPKMDWDAVGDDMLPDIAEAMIGRDNMSLDQKAAVDAMRRDAEIAASNPFIPDGAGVRAHQEGLAEAMARIMADVPATVASPRVLTPGAPMPRLRGSTAISSGIVAGDARAVVKSRIGIVESGGSNAAKNPNSSATGTYQFITGTWVKLYKSRYGDGGLSDAQIAAKRSDPRLQEILMDDLMTVNERSLRGAGHAADAGNMYLAHFAGPGGANKLLSADPNASARSVLGDRAVAANPFLRNMTADDVVQWAHRKMTGKAGPRGTTSGSRETLDPEADLRARLDDELAAIDAERARLDAEDEAEATPISDMIDEAANVRGEVGQPLVDASPRPVEPTARLPEAPPVEVMAIMPQLRELVRSREVSLNEPAKLAKALGVDESELRQGLMALALNREIRQNKKGQFMRLPRDLGPVDLLKFVARSGGVTPDGLNIHSRKLGTRGHDLRTMFAVTQTRRRKVGKGALSEVREHKVETTHMISGAGHVVRESGRSLDDLGELLHEAGYFGDPQGVRPTESEVLELLETAYRQGQKIYPLGMTPEGRPVTSRDPWIDEYDRATMQRAFEREADDLEIALDDEAFEAAARLYADGDYENVGDAILDMVNREIEADRLATLYEAGDDYYDSQIDEFLASAREAGFDVDGGVDRPALLDGDAGTQGAARGNDIGQSAQESPTELNPEIYRAFDDPVEGAGAATQIASMEHDLRATTGVYGKLEIADEDEFGGPRLVIYDPADKTIAPANIIVAVDNDGVATIEVDGLAASAAQQAGVAADGANRFGPAHVRDALRQIKAAFPEIKSFQGERLTGAGAGRNQVIDVEKANPAIDPAIVERQAQQAALKANSPMQAKVDQDSTIGSPLFDAVDQYGFRLDAEGDAINPADLLAELDADAAVLKTIKDCL